MIILQDSREQCGLIFDHPWVTNVVIQKLDIGDYAAVFKDGHKPNIVFERKSLADLYGTMGYGYRRFKKCIQRAHKQGTTLFIIVEGTLSRVLRGYDHSTISGVSLIYKLFTLWMRHGVQTIFTKDREEMAEYITNFYIAAGKEYIRKKKLG